MVFDIIVVEYLLFFFGFAGILQLFISIIKVYTCETTHSAMQILLVYIQTHSAIQFH